MIEILDSFLKKVDILRKYTYAQYTEEFRGIGSFKINVPIIEENKYLLDETEQYYVLFDTKRNGKNKKIRIGSRLHLSWLPIFYDGQLLSV